MLFAWPASPFIICRPLRSLPPLFPSQNTLQTVHSYPSSHTQPRQNNINAKKVLRGRCARRDTAAKDPTGSPHCWQPAPPAMAARLTDHGWRLLCRDAESHRWVCLGDRRGLRRYCGGGAARSGVEPTGDHCPEGWAFYQYPGPGFQGIGENSAESSYYTWVDQHNTFGLGAVAMCHIQPGLLS